MNVFVCLNLSVFFMPTFTIYRIQHDAIKDEEDPPPDELQATFLDGERIDLDQLRHLQEYDADMTRNQKGKKADREILKSGRVGLIVLPTDIAELAAGRLAIELATDGPCATRASGGRVVGAVIDGIEFLTAIKGPAMYVAGSPLC